MRYGAENIDSSLRVADIPLNYLFPLFIYLTSNLYIKVHSENKKINKMIKRIFFSKESFIISEARISKQKNNV
jgi:hypothetical protein